MIPQHLSLTNEHYTPLSIIDKVKLVFDGVIDTDPATCQKVNLERVQAKQYFDADGLNKEWSGNLFLNPPGGKINNKSSQSIWFTAAVNKYKKGEIDSVIFLAFNMEILRIASDLLTNQWVCIPHKRIAYDIYHADSQKYCPQKSPPHTSILIYLGQHPERFRTVFADMGTIWHLANQ